MPIPQKEYPTAPIRKGLAQNVFAKIQEQ
jgi:hypothetical protein